LLVGVVFANDVPTGSEITVLDQTNDKTAGTFYSNSASGNYRIALLPGSKYSIKVSVPEFEEHVDEIDLETLKEYIEVSNNIYFYSNEFVAENEVQENKPIEEVKTQTLIAAAIPVKEKAKEKKVVPVPGSPCDDMVDLSAFIGKDLNKQKNYNKLLTAIGEYCADELEYRVQIGAYRFPQNFKYPYLSQFGEAEITDYPDGITRFTLGGSHTTLKAADEMRQKFRKAGQDDAWVIPFYDGQRIFMEDLIEVNFYKQEIN